MIKCKNACPEKKFDGCCHGGCPHAENCLEKCQHSPYDCEESIFEGTDIEVFQSKAAAVIQRIGNLVQQKVEIEAAEKSMREQLQQAMEQHGIKTFDNEIIKITYVDASTRESIDGMKLKAQMPEIAAKFVKRSNVKAFVKIELKGGEKK